MSIAPASGRAGSTATVVISWAPTAATDCSGSEAEVRVNGEPASDPIPVSAEPSRVEVDIPEDVEADIPISLVSVDEDARVLASSQFTVEGGEEDEEVSSWLLVAAGLVATLIALAIQRIYSRRRARYGRR
ncbi:MAG TPA: hypothetical protein VHJ78_09720 [Actinomycetota bacterium]|nr:hypothetical protein [Actinomycetota bacterium]